jgi:hypothetical protein
MQFEEVGRGWEYLSAALVVCLVFVAALHRPRSEVSWSARIGAGLICLISTYSSFMQGFVRHDSSHVGVFYSTIVVLVYVLAASGAWTYCVTVTGLAILALSASTSASVSSLVDPSPSVQAVLRDASLVLSSSQRSQAVSDASLQARAAYAVPELLINRLGARPVHVDPYESSLPWAYDLSWKPLPIFQSYAAYSAALDRRDARAAGSGEARPWILRHKNALTIDLRNPLWEAPQTQLSLLCRYEVEAEEGDWQLLRPARNRCGHPRVVAVDRVVANETVAIPSVDDQHLLVARFTPRLSARIRLEQLIFKSQPLMINTDAGFYRVPDGLAGGPLLLRAPQVSFLRLTGSSSRPGAANASQLTASSPTPGYHLGSLAPSVAGTLTFSSIKVH